MTLCLFTGCDDDDIVGKWKYDNTIIGEVKTSSDAATKIITDDIYDLIMLSLKEGTIEFTSGGNCPENYEVTKNTLSVYDI